MAEFDLLGLGKARMALTEMSKTPSSRNSKANGIKYRVIHELYAEIRAARIAGHSWNKITEAIKKEVNIPLSGPFLRQAFEEIDKSYEKETGVKALRAISGGERRRGE